jgi:type VI secretion system secreted protein Hcp
MRSPGNCNQEVPVPSTRRLTRSALATLALGSLLLIPPAVASTVYMWVDGEIQGPIDGSVTDPGLEGSTRIFAVDHSVIVPYDPDTGLPTGAAQHAPFIVVKETDRATVPLIQARATGERLEVTVRFYEVDQTGQRVNYYTVLLHLATVVDHGLIWDSETGTQSPLSADRFALVYRNVTWRWEDGGFEVTDDWSSTPAGTPAGSGGPLALLAPTPNPSRGETFFRFELPQAGTAELNVLDVGGRRVRQLLDEAVVGEQTAAWDGRDQSGAPVANGVYIVRLSWPGGEATRRVTLLR